MTLAVTIASQKMHGKESHGERVVGKSEPEAKPTHYPPR